MYKLPEKDVQPPGRMLTFKSGGWVLLLSGVLMAAILARLLIPVFEKARSGDYPRSRDSAPGYAGGQGGLVSVPAPCLIPQDEIHRGATKDAIPALTDPEIAAGKDVEEMNKRRRRIERRKFLLGGDRVIGLTISGQSRAYPLNILSWHEIVNDTLGGMPIAVTYCPLCDSVLVFDRRAGGEVLEFGVSGLLYNSNILLYDRRLEGEGAIGESLWSQLQMRAVCGPAAEAGLTLDLIPAELVHWSDWFARHPDTTVISDRTGYGRKYGRNPYGQYFDVGKLRFPVNPEPPAGGPPAMARVLAVQVDGGWKLFDYEGKTWRDRIAQQSILLEESAGLKFHFEPQTPSMDPATVRVVASDGSIPTVVYSFWFAWHAMNPGGKQPVPAEY